jgi:hypothetical protein
MTREERLALIEKLRADNDAAVIEVAERKAAREERGEYEPLVSKRLDVQPFDPAEAIADQLYQQRSYQARPTDSVVTADYLEAHEQAMIDATVAHVSEVLKPLQEQINRLEAELALVRSLARGEITLIGKHDAKAS